MRRIHGGGVLTSPGNGAMKEIGRADKVGDELAPRPSINFLRAAALNDPAGAENRDRSDKASASDWSWVT